MKRTKSIFENEKNKKEIYNYNKKELVIYEAKITTYKDALNIALKVLEDIYKEN